MLLKGIISAVHADDNTAEILLPEHANAVTAPLNAYNRTLTAEMVGSFVVVAVFGPDWNDGVIL